MNRLNLRHVRRVTRWNGFQRIAAVVAIEIVLIWFYLVNLQGDQKSFSATILNVGFMTSVAVVALIAFKRNWEGFWWVVLMVTVAVVGVFLSQFYWADLHSDDDSVSTTFRNLGLVIGGIIAILLAIWRSTVAERQSATAQQGLLNERYQKGAEMLGSDVLSVRLGGIYALERLAAEHPKQYHILVMKLFCAFVPHIVNGSNQPLDSATTPADPSPDVQAVMDAIGARGESETNIERLASYRPDLRRVVLCRASLGKANLSNALLSWTCLRQAALGEANLADAILNQADLTGATLGGTNLIGASLHRAILQSAVFWDLPGPLRFITYYDALREGNVLTADLSAARLDHSDLSYASLQGSNMSSADLTNAILSGADLSGANLSGAILVGADLSGVTLSENGKIPVTGLTQGQLDEACASPNDPPNLTGVVDYSTHKALIWRGGQPSDGQP